MLLGGASDWTMARITGLSSRQHGMVSCQPEYAVSVALVGVKASPMQFEPCWGRNSLVAQQAVLREVATHGLIVQQSAPM